MAVIEKKTWPEFFEKVSKGEKNADIRLADFELKNGDILILKEWDPLRQRYTGRSISKIVKNVTKVNLSAFWDIKRIKNNGVYLIEL